MLYENGLRLVAREKRMTMFAHSHNGCSAFSAFYSFVFISRDCQKNKNMHHVHCARVCVRVCVCFFAHSSLFLGDIWLMSVCELKGKSLIARYVSHCCEIPLAALLFFFIFHNWIALFCRQNVNLFYTLASFRNYVNYNRCIEWSQHVYCQQENMQELFAYFDIYAHVLTQCVRCCYSCSYLMIKR